MERQARAVLARLWAEDYAERVRPWRAIVRITVRRTQCSPAQAPLIVAHNAKAKGNELPSMALLWLLAAAADELEGEKTDVQAHAG